MIAKLGLWVRTLISASSKGCPDKLTTHLLLLLVTVPSLSSLFDVKLCTVSFFATLSAIFVV